MTDDYGYAAGIKANYPPKEYGKLLCKCGHPINWHYPSGCECANRYYSSKKGRWVDGCGCQMSVQDLAWLAGHKNGYELGYEDGHRDGKEAGRLV